MADPSSPADHISLIGDCHHRRNKGEKLWHRHLGKLSSVGFTIANGGITSGLTVSVFLTSAAVGLVRRRATDMTVVNPLEPPSQLINDFMKRGGSPDAEPRCP